LSNKVLIITYYWPPSGGAGVQRWLKFSKYLPLYGWQPVILTVDPEYAAYPVTDNSLLKNLSSELEIHLTRATDYFAIYKKDKTRIPAAGFAYNIDNTLKGRILRFIRGNFFLPDPRRGWNKYAFKKACELIESGNITHVITTSPPHSTQLIGLKIKKKYPGINWIADLRDPWTDIYYYNLFYPTFISKLIDSAYEKKVLNKADKIVTVGSSLKALFSSKLSGAENKITVITNGFDDDDFAGLDSSSPEIFTISYTGTLSDTYPVTVFLDALDFIREEGYNYRLKFIGTVTPKQKDLILSRSGAAPVEFISYVDHPTAIKYMLETSVLLLIIPVHKSNRSIITGKIFEYIASGKPIVCVGPPDGDAAEILKETGHGRMFSYSDSKGIQEYMTTLILGNSHDSRTGSKVYSASELTKQLTSLF
jgi:glycosyltransferase involved in cell wall biosynthesis